MNVRAYSLLTVKAVEESDGKRIVKGLATTPAVDRVGDTINPLGVKFAASMPFLWQHRHDQPIGWVTFGKPTKDGIPFEAEVAQTDEEGELKGFLDKCWQQLKLKLVRAVSIGFRPIKWAWIGDYDGIEYQEIEVYELSAVTIPANSEALITDVSGAKGAEAMAGVIKSFDTGAPAATGRPTPPEKTPPGVAGKTSTSISLTPKEGKAMNIGEQIAALETLRAAKAARLEEIQTKAASENRTKDAGEREEFTSVKDELKAIDEELADLRDLEKTLAVKAKPIDPAIIKSPQDGAAARLGATPGVQVVLEAKAEPGVRFARLAKVRAVSRLEGQSMLAVAEEMYGRDSETAAIVKAAVAAGTTLSGNWAANLVGAETSAFADFAAYLRPATIVGKFGTNGIPSLRRVPFREALISQTAGGSGYWVGEGKPKPVTSFGFGRTSLTPLKVANICVLTEENIRSSSPSSELIVRDALRDALVQTQDLSFIDPTNSGTSDVKPASITNGAGSVTSTGTDADAIRLDVRAAFQKFIDADNAPEDGVWIMSTTNALALSMMVNPLGQKEFPGITMMGGTFEGLPVIATRHAGTNVVLVNASDIYLADDGEVAVDMSREASIEMLDGSLQQDGTAGTGASLVSMFQTNSVALRGERTINWKRRRTSAVAYIKSANWGGGVPNS